MAAAGPTSACRATSSAPGRGSSACTGSGCTAAPRRRLVRWPSSSSDVTEARRAEAVRRDFVANVGHELKTPVGALALLAEAIEQAADDPEAVQRFAGRIAHEADRLGRLVREVIDLSRLQGGEPLPELVPVDLDVVIAEAVDRTRTAARAKGLDIAVGGETGLVVRGVESQLATAVTNLLANAVAYSAGENRIAVAARSRSGFAEIAVTDSGIGIPRSDRHRVFERFYRVDQSRASSTGGTGLGLAIVKHVASNHGGSVSVWSEEGLGSTFTLRIPLVAGVRPDPRSWPTLLSRWRKNVHDPSARRRGRGVVLRRAVLHAAPRGLRGRRGIDRPGRARRVRPGRRRHRAARPDAARACPVPRSAGRCAAAATSRSSC